MGRIRAQMPYFLSGESDDWPDLSKLVLCCAARRRVAGKLNDSLNGGRTQISCEEKAMR